MVLSRNKIIMNDAALYGSPITNYSIETRVEYSVLMEIPDLESSDNAYLTAFINMDDSHRTT